MLTFELKPGSSTSNVDVKPKKSRSRKRSQDENSGTPIKRAKSTKKATKTISQSKNPIDLKPCRQPSRFTVPVLSYRKHPSEVSTSTLSALASKLASKPIQEEVRSADDVAPAQQPEGVNSDTETTSLSSLLRSTSAVLLKTPSPVKRPWSENTSDSSPKRQMREGPGWSGDHLCVSSS